ncbi:hypothetical protein [Arthrobacter sp. ISL-30]|nr:hypothetical protein [Arthrobacter sp. ISL-30]MBT2514537.1 hypothetical protein [Arthrobacter sp. ISL-30]
MPVVRLFHGSANNKRFTEAYLRTLDTLHELGPQAAVEQVTVKERDLA